MDISELKEKLNVFFKERLPAFLKDLPRLVREFPDKFKKMSLGEQVAYVCIGVGVLLMIVSLFLF